MSFSYSPLWLTLAKKGMSKTDFRLKTGISTATLAKLSSNQQISLEVIGKICETLNCRMDEVITYQAESEDTIKWHTLLQNATYHISLWFLEENDTFTYIYGYAVPHPTSFSASKWHLESPFSENGLTIWNVSGFTDSPNTRHLIDCLESNQTLGDYMKHSNIELSHSRRTADTAAATGLQEAQLGCHAQCYRPAILLEPVLHTAKLLPEFQPFHSYDESEPMLCESITCLDKRSLYKTNDVIDSAKMEVLHRFFREYHFLAGGISDIGRIGNFELFSWLSETQESDAVFEVEIIKEKVSSKKSAAHLTPENARITGIQVTLHHPYLDGDYLLEAEAWNANNQIMKEIRLLTCSGQDMQEIFKLHECCSEICINLWEMNSGTTGKMIGSKHVPLMRDIFLKTQITERKGILKDSWTSISPEKDRPGRNTGYQHHTSHTSHIGSADFDPWRPEIKNVYHDFEKIYGTEDAESMFFPKGWESHEEFLKYFKTLLSKNNPERVIIIDPHIDDLAITRILRSIQDNGCYYDIITDFNTGRTPPEIRIPKLEKACTECRNILPPKFTITGFQVPSKKMLHDRYLMLKGTDGQITVYQMSNSLDNAATSHAFSIAKNNRYTSHQIYHYYQQMVQDSKNNGTLKIIYDNTVQNTDPLTENEDPHEKSTEFLQYFNRLLSDSHLPELTLDEQQNFVFGKELIEEQLSCIAASALHSWAPVGTFLAWLVHPHTEQLKDILKKKYGTQLVPVLSDYLASVHLEDSFKENSPKSNYEYSIAVSLGQALQNEDFPKLLEIAKALLEYRYGCLFYCGNYALSYAIELLADLSLQEFAACLSSYLKMKHQASAELICAFFVVHLTQNMESHSPIDEILAGNLLVSSLPQLRSIGIQWYIRHFTEEPEQFVSILQKLTNSNEQNYAMTSMAVHLQVEVCRHKQDPQKWQNLLNRLKSLWPALLPAHLDKNTTKEYFEPMEFRSIPDVCDLIHGAYFAGKIDSDTAADFLTDLAFQKASDAQSEKSIYFQIKDLQDSTAILEILHEIDEKFVLLFFQRMIKLVKKILPNLRKPFFRSMNYRLWRQLIDLLCWCCCIRSVLQNALTSDGTSNEFEENKEFAIGMERLFRETEALFHEADIILENYSQTLIESSELYRYYQR